ncbi:MAG: MotA/TolQ/ExbB proton channel family protein, partial [Flavobacteriaceae bacterium]|nr:MotA/TolQ/ExbB proton channel family protein [Flavobacteriaceae bacterium]
MKRLFSILAMAGLFVLSTNTVSAKANAMVSNLSATVATAVMTIQET